MQPLSRRRFLHALALLSACLPTAGCEPMISLFSDYAEPRVPKSLSLPKGATIDPAFHLLSRAAFAPWPGDLERVRKVGTTAWIDEQLKPDSIDDRICTLRSRRFESLLLPPGECYEFKQEIIRRDLVRHALLRAVYTRRQLQEVMVEFWTDHFNINIGKGDCIYLKPFDDREVIRKHALGSFRDLVRASALSPAMLIYLDGAENKKGSPKDVPNENYARELMELHTLGVDGGYTQHDVFEAARCLTGWTVASKGGHRGTAAFDPALHDQDAKVVLGKQITARGGEKDLDALVDVVCSHPSTARYLARKLCVRFVSYDPPASLVDSTAKVFATTHGSIKDVLRHILLSTEFAASAGTKIKRPFQHIAGSLRLLAADTHAHDELVDYLLRMGQGPFQYPTPDGYPDEGAPWLGTLLWRWNFAFELCSSQVPNVEIPTEELVETIGAAGGDKIRNVFAYLTGRQPTDTEYGALTSISQCSKEYMPTLFALVMSSPAFLRC